MTCMVGILGQFLKKQAKCVTAMDKNDQLFRNLCVMIESHDKLAARNASLLEHDMTTIINSREQDPKQIEHTLDLLLDIAFMPAGLELFKRLCRYYYVLNPVATRYYIYGYKEMWGTNDAEND